MAASTRRGDGLKASLGRQVSYAQELRPLRNGFEIRSGKRVVALKHATTPQEALVDYLRGIGCSDDEIVRMGVSAISWRGAVFSAVQAAA